MASSIPHTNDPPQGFATPNSSAKERGMAPWPAAAFCFLLSLAMHLPWLANTPIAGTEGHRIFPAHEMVQSHFWLAPTLFGEPFLTKPPLHHWLIAVCEVLSGGGHSFDVGGPKALFFWRLPSAVTGAALCAAVCIFGARWFGRTAGLISGVCAVGMICIWGQSQVADIDSTNTLATALAALLGVELLIVRPTRSAGWLIAASLAMAAMWMTKGPAGLPIVLGVWIWAIWTLLFDALGIQIWPIPAVMSDASRRPAAAGDKASNTPKRNLASFVVLWIVPWIIGVVIFLLWAWAAKKNLVHRGLHLDDRGVKEGTKRLYAHSPGDFLKSLFVMLPQVIAFGLPTVLAIPFFFVAELRAGMNNRSRRLALAMVGSTFISWGVCVFSGMENPRYAYPTLMLLCLLAGAMVVEACKIRRLADWLRGIAIGSAIAFMLATIGLTVAAWKAVDFRLLLIVSCLLALFVAGWMVPQLLRRWNAVWGLVALIALTSIPFGVQRHWSRATKDSAITTAPTLRQIIGEGGTVVVAGAVTSKPEAFYYAGVRTRYVPVQNMIPKSVEPGVWIMLDQAEHKRWLKQPNSRLENDRVICKWGVTDYYLGWYPAKR